MVHATRTMWGQAATLCDLARQHLVNRARSSGGSGFTARGFDTSVVTCADCTAVLRGGVNALPTPEIVSTPPPEKNPLGGQIRADMRRRYGPGIEREEWEVEAYR